MIALAALLTPVLLSVSAYASEGNFAGGQQGGGRDSVTDTKVLLSAMDDLTGVVGQVFTVIVSNPFLVVLAASSLLALGVRIFKKVKRTAKG